ncbi:MAG TPA: PEP/pyruvate-binding domain-containing protein [Syntrophales bacterium]|jgi:pyruvate,water dikinase|nr:PEP/pyruvate-binding domain-containing protein [Syntrophales bacterium]HPX55255.1 PEP/pyruvate-binding domain-containing protein [Syntrophales bacterium]
MYLTDFSTITGIEEEGGKGHNLKRLVSFGVNVPPGFVIGASFYRDYYPPPPQFAFTDDAKLDYQCAEMRACIKGHEPKADLAPQVLEMINHLRLTGRFAVRSSSTFEDLASAAFAGQHETYLNVPAPEIWDKVRLCFASLWQKHAVLYRNHHGFDQSETSMAVVVQQMIDPDVAGVAFSVDPVGGNLSHILIEANYGLGESIVGGETVTDSWIVDKNSWNIVEKRINRKEKKTISGSLNGIQYIPIDPDLQERPCLNDEQVVMVAQAVRTIEQRFGSPEDVEWALVSNELYITQSRPQTKIPPHFTRAESAERFPEPLTPLTWSYVEEAFGISLEFSLRMMGVSLPARPWFALIDSYVYGNQNAVELLAQFRPLDMSSLKRLEEQVPEMQARFQWIVDLPQRWLRDLDVYLLNIGRLNSADFRRFDMPDFQQFSRELAETATEYFKPNIAISMTQALLTRTLFEYVLLLTGDVFRTQDTVKKLLASSGTKTGQINREIYHLAQTVQKQEDLLRLLEENPPDIMRRLEAFGDFMSEFKRFINNYGHREVTFDYYKPTWAEAPVVVLALIRLAASTQMSDPAIKELDTRKTSTESLQEILGMTPESLRYFVNELVRLTAIFTWLDDLEHFQTTRLNLIVRKSIGSLGERFVQGGFIEDKYDLFFLEKPEIESLEDFVLQKSLIDVINKRKRNYRNAFKREPVWDLRNVDEIQSADEGVLKGVPGSPGVVEGQVYLVRGVEDFSGMPEGAIIVAQTTNPSWTPLFYRAKGLITESGGPLSHGAVTARELGLPAVMFIRNALRCFNNGDRVRLNGQRGEVIII